MISELKLSDNFFHYGENDIEQEISSDVLSLILQPKRSLLYSRSIGSAGVDQYENNPNTMLLTILIPYDILMAVSRRNNVVGNGQNGTKERRVATSQSLIKIKQDQGELDVTAQYIPLSNLNRKIQVNSITGLTGGK